ncbi:MAG: hypothetical protein CMJ81_15455 [Planctomycetaceae bacterium]|nr:hypothetical protein [Planctomycetaceae bacterium]
MNSSDLDDYRWLVSDEAAKWLHHAAEQQNNLVSLTSQLRRQLSARRTHLILDQVQLRRRGRVKFKAADQMFFTRKGLQQATGQTVAEYKAARFDSAISVVDLCCGIGGDLLALREGRSVQGVERCAVTALLAAANCCRLSSERTKVLGRDLLVSDVADVQAWHLDPDRRVKGGRTVQIQLQQPNDDMISKLLERNRNGAVKLAPASVVPDAWLEQAQIEWISHARECKQSVVWFGELADKPGRRSATHLTPDGKAEHFHGLCDLPVPVAPDVARFVVEPDPAILAARLNGALAAAMNLQAISSAAAYLTADSPLQSRLTTSFEIQEMLPFEVKRIRRLLRERQIGHLELKKRGVRIDLIHLRKQLSCQGEHAGTLLLMPRGRGTIAVLARRAS